MISISRHKLPVHSLHPLLLVAGGKGHRVHREHGYDGQHLVRTPEGRGHHNGTRQVGLQRKVGQGLSQGGQLQAEVLLLFLLLLMCHSGFGWKCLLQGTWLHIVSLTSLSPPFLLLLSLLLCLAMDVLCHTIFLLCLLYLHLYLVLLHGPQEVQLLHGPQEGISRGRGHEVEGGDVAHPQGQELEHHRGEMAALNLGNCVFTEF